jgi:hypothetical protein
VTQADDSQPCNQQGGTPKRRRAPNDQLQTHGAHPSAAASPLPLYADPDWIAANFGQFERQTVDALLRLGASREDAIEAFHDAVLQLYAEPKPDLTDRRAVSRFLRLASFRLLSKQRHKLGRIRLEAEVDEAAVDPEAEAAVEYRLRLDEALKALYEMGPVNREALLAALRRELVAMTGTEPDTGGSSGSTVVERKRLSRARMQLRQRTRDWRAGIALPRLHRNDFGDRHVPASIGAVLCVASVVVVSLPRAGEPSRAASIAPSNMQQSSLAPPDPPQRPAPTAGSTANHDVRQVTSLTQPSPAEPEHAGVSAQAPTPLLEGSTLGATNHSRPAGDDSLVCVRRLRPLEDTCVDHPLRTDGPPVPQPGP